MKSFPERRNQPPQSTADSPLTLKVQNTLGFFVFPPSNLEEHDLKKIWFFFNESFAFCWKLQTGTPSTNHKAPAKIPNEWTSRILRDFTPLVYAHINLKMICTAFLSVWLQDITGRTDNFPNTDVSQRQKNSWQLKAPSYRLPLMSLPQTSRATIYGNSES
jgi:hypothetical protein